MNKRQKLVQKQFLNNEEAVIKRLNQVYNKSLTDINENIKNLSFKIGKLEQEYDWLDVDDPERAKVKSMIQSKIYQKQFQEQLRDQVDGILNQMQTKQYLTVSDYLDECYTDGFIGTVFDMFGQDVPLILPINQESMVKAVQIDSKISEGLYTRLGKDVNKLKNQITAQVSRAISTGMSFKQAAKQLENYSKIGYNRAVRIARTEGHRIQNSATMDACYSAKARGADVVKQWDATLDARTRESHQMVDGEVRELDKKFSNGLMFPGDPSGGAAEVVNCRCALLQRARWALEDEVVIRRDNETGELIQCKNYAEFKEKYLSSADRLSEVNIQKVATTQDKEQFNRYKATLGNVAPKTLDEFYKIKHGQEDAWKHLKYQYRTVNQYKIDSGHLTPQQILDLDTKVISEKRKNFGGKFRTSGNIAGAYIDGDSNNFFIAHSRISGKDDIAESKYKGKSTLVQLLTDRQFDYIPVVEANGELRTETFEDTEAKIFEHLALLYAEKPFKSVTILSERGMCDSCLGVMEQFKKKFNVEVNAVSNKKVTGNVWGKRWR